MSLFLRVFEGETSLPPFLFSGNDPENALEVELWVHEVGGFHEANRLAEVSREEVSDRELVLEESGLELIRGTGSSNLSVTGTCNRGKWILCSLCS